LRLARRLAGEGELPDPSAASNHWERVVSHWERIQAGGGQLRPHYTWCLLHVAGVASHLGYERFRAIELGCAGGNGLIALEAAAPAVEEAFGVAIELHGFDMGTGLPKPADYRDVPYLVAEGDFPMRVGELREKLERTELHLGPIRETIGGFATSDAPVGLVINDLDLYSSTRDALQVFLGPAESLLPRVLCYYDDVLGYPWGETNGEQAANADFNAEHGSRRLIDRLTGMRYLVPQSQFHERWVDSLYLAHVLDHPRYSEYEGTAILHRLDLALP
jgi:hypothetical protein